MSSSPTPNKQDKPTRQRRSWKSRLLRIGIVLIALVVVFRVALALLLPVAISRAAGFYGLDCDYGRARLSLTGGYATIWDVRVTQKEDGKQVLGAQFCEASISVLNLLRAKLVVFRVGADGVDVDLQREADGSIPLLQKFASPPAKEAVASGEPETELDLRAPFQVDAFRLTNVRAHVVDRSVTPAFDGMIHANVHVSELGQGETPAQIEVGVWSEQVLDQLRVIGEASSVGRNVKAKFRMQARGINPTGAAAYLKVLGIRPVSRDLNMTANLAVETSGVEGSLKAIKGTATLTDVRLYADGTDALKIGSITLSPRYVGLDRIDAGAVTISDISATAKRLPEGFEFAGIVYAGVPAKEMTNDQNPMTNGGEGQPRAVGKPTLATTQAIALPAVSLDELLIKNVRLAFADQAVQPAAKLGLTLKTLRLANLATYAGKTPKPVELSAELAAEGIAESITLSGKADPFAEAKTGNFRMQIAGIRLDPLRPYLEMVGLESTLTNGSLNCEFSAGFRARSDGMLEGQIIASDITLVDKAPLLKLTDARITGCEVNPATLEVKIGAIDIAGPSLSGVRTAQGQFEILGVRTKGLGTAPAAESAAPVATTAEPTAGIVLPIPRITLERFTWKDIRLELQDDSAQPPTKLMMTDAGIELKDLRFELADRNRPAHEATLLAWMYFPGMVDDLKITGTIAPTLRSIGMKLDTRIEGITGSVIAPYTAAAGVTPVLKKGRLQMHTESYAELTTKGLAAEFLLKGLTLEDAGAFLAGVDGLQVKGFRMEPPLMAVESVKVTRPRIAVERQVDGSMVMLGVKTGAVATPQANRAGSPPPLPLPQGGGNEGAATGSLRIPELPLVSAEQIVVEGAEVQWTDRLFAPAVQIGANADLSLSGVRLGTKAEAAKVKVRAAVPGSIEKIVAEGLLTTWPGEMGMDWSVQASGIRGGAVEAYLPPTLAVGMKDGQASLRTVVRVANNPAGGISANADVRNLDVREATAATPLLGIGSVKVNATRVDPAKLVIALDEVAVTGITAAAERTAEGDVLAGGIRALAQAAKDRPAPVVAREDQAARKEQEVGDILAAARKVMPEIAINRLLVAADEIRFRDGMRPNAAPVAIERLRVWNTDRLAWLGKDPLSQPANKIELSMQIQPVVDLLHVQAEVTPFAAQPSAHVRVQANGLQGEGLNALLPELAGVIDGAPLKDGQVHAEVEVAARVDRRGPVQFDFAHEFQVDLSLRDVALRNGDSERVLAGVQEVRANAVRVDPANKRVQIPSLEIVKPIAYAWREKDGVYALGMRMPIEAGASTETAGVQGTPSLTLPQGGGDEQGTPAQRANGMDVHVRKLMMNGIDVVFEDRSVEPRVVVPLTQLDVEVQDVGTTSLKQSKPIRFAAMLGSGKVELQKRGRGRHGAGAETGIEQRDLFSLITANGSVSLYPQPNGWAKASVNGMELMAFGGLAKQFDMGLHDGILDAEVDVRIQSQQEMDVRARAVVTDLSLSEAPNGPIARAMKLSAPLDMTLRLLEDPDGSITLPVKFRITDGKLSYGSLISSATGAAIQAIATAVASSPVKLVQGVGGLLGADGGKEKKEIPTAVIHFAPGTATIEPAELSKLRMMIDRARRDRSVQMVVRHELSEADQAMAEARANPSPQDASDMIRTLRARRAELLAQQDVQAVQVRTRLAAVSEQQMADDLRDLRVAQQQLASVESALDQLLDLQRPGADRQAGRRARAMALVIGQARLDAVKTVVTESPRVAERLNVAPASAQVIAGLKSGQIVVTLISR